MDSFLIPGMLSVHETEDCIGLLQEDPLFDRRQFSVCQSLVLHGGLVLGPINRKKNGYPQTVDFALGGRGSTLVPILFDRSNQAHSS